MALRAFIGSVELKLPDNFSVPSDLHSPLYDSSLRIGDFTMNIIFPFCPENRIAFDFADELHQTNKQLVYPDFRVEEDGAVVLQGVLKRRLSNSSLHKGNYVTDFLTNFLEKDIANMTLAELLELKTVNLGSSTAAILAAALAQNNASMSTNGTTGSVMKFVPHYNPEFYGDTNPDFYPEVSNFNPDTDYEKGKFVTFKMPNNQFLLSATPSFCRAGLEDHLVDVTGWNNIPFDIETGEFYDPNGLHAAGVYTAPDAGTYIATLEITIKNVSLASHDYFLHIDPGVGVIGDFVQYGGNLASGEIVKRKIWGYFDSPLDGLITAEFNVGTIDVIRILSAKFQVEENTFIEGVPEMLLEAETDVEITTAIPYSDPIRNPAWALRSRGIINNFDSSAQVFEQNDEVDIELNKYYPNENTLVPFLQTHAVLHAVLNALGWKLKGTYMDDAVEQRELIASNYALDKDSGNDGSCYVGHTAAFELSRFGNQSISYTKEDGAFYDPNDLWDGTEYTCPTNGYYEYIRTVEIFNYGAGDGLVFEMEIYDAFDEVISESIPSSIDENERASAKQTVVGYRDAGQPIISEMGYSGTVDGVVLLYRTLKIRCLTTDNRNVFDGNVKYSNHVPDMTPAELLATVIKAKSLFPIWDLQNKTLTLDYLKDVLSNNADMKELQPYAEDGQQIQEYQKRRYEINYGNLPSDTFTPTGNEDQLEPVTNIRDLTLPTSQNNIILVKNEPAWYGAKAHPIYNTLYWYRLGSAYPLLKIERDGELNEIKPAMGPVNMKNVVTMYGQLALIPVTDGQGRSAMFNTQGDKLPFTTCYWIGYDTSIGRNYPLAGTTKYNAAGTIVSPADMSIATLYELRWKRIIQMMVLEEVVTTHFKFPPELRKLISFSRLFLLGHVPIIPIRTMEAIGGNGTLEIEARKVKMVEVEIVSDVVVEEEEGALWTPSDTITAFWVDAADAATVTIEEGAEYWNDKSGNDEHAQQTSESLQPEYVIAAQNGLNVMRFNNDSYMGTSFGHNQPFTTFSAGRFNEGLSGTITMHSGSPTPSDRSGQIFFTTGSGGSFGIFNGGAGVISGGSYRTTPIMFTGVHNTTESEFYIDGDLKASGNSGSQILNDFMIGAQTNGSYRMRGDIYEIVIVSGVPTDELREKIEGYMAWKWGMQDNLLLEHPYRLSPPYL